MAQNRKKPGKKRNKSRKRPKAKARTASERRTKPEIDHAPETPEDRTMPGGKEITPTASTAVSFKTQAKSIRNYLCDVDYQENCSGLAHVYDLRRHFIANLIETEEQEPEDGPDFGDLPRRSGGNYVAGLTGLAEYCEHAAELLEAPETIHQ